MTGSDRRGPGRTRRGTEYEKDVRRRTELRKEAKRGKERGEKMLRDGRHAGTTRGTRRGRQGLKQNGVRGSKRGVGRSADDADVNGIGTARKRHLRSQSRRTAGKNGLPATNRPGEPLQKEKRTARMRQPQKHAANEPNRRLQPFRNRTAPPRTGRAERRIPMPAGSRPSDGRSKNRHFFVYFPVSISRFRPASGSARFRQTK